LAAPFTDCAAGIQAPPAPCAHTLHNQGVDLVPQTRHLTLEPLDCIVPGDTVPETNRLLAALAPEVYAQLQPALAPVRLRLGQVLLEPAEPVRQVYFLRSGMVSLLSCLEDGSGIEVAIVGTEGIVGLSLFLGAGVTQTRAICQLAGTAARLAAPAFLAAVQENPRLQQLLLRYTQARIDQMTLTAACNSHHGTEARLARWLLTTQDRAQNARFLLTHEFLGDMLDVRRATVSQAASAFQQAGLIRYVRGQVTIVDRPGLEARTCECYGRIRETYQRAYP
jgi:CRP-like cAMP-binding protein